MDESVADFSREAAAVGASVHVTKRMEIADLLNGLLEGSGPVVLAAGLEDYAQALRGLGHDAVVEGPDGAVPTGLLDAGVGICEALAGVSVSGTVLLGPGAGSEGVISMLPPHCIVLIERRLIYEDVGTALKATSRLVETPGSRLVFVTGPSRTSDIELTPVVGVHGPLRLDLVVVDG